MKKALIALATIVAVSAWARPAHAVPVLDFNIDSGQPGGATLSYNGSGGALSGTSIGVDSVAGTGGTPLHNAEAPIAITNGLLSFTSGAETNSGDANLVWGANANSCTSLTDANCSLVITGGVSGPINIASGTVLLAGKVVSASIQSGIVSSFTFANFVDSTLASYFGYSGGTQGFSNGPVGLNLSLNANLVGPSGFTCTPVSTACNPLSGDLTTLPVGPNQQVTATPEPGSLVLLGTGLLVSARGFRRRPVKKS